MGKLRFESFTSVLKASDACQPLKAKAVAEMAAKREA
jgi:hypothetical protein